jgi:two-component system LytT family sensor kinase
LRDEIKFIDDYLGIELIRFGDKLRFEKDVDEDVLDRLAPSMILQPIVENSIKHGLANKVGGGTIRLRIWRDASRLHMIIEDDGIGIEEAKLMKLFEQGIGVSNVNERLKVLFESNYRFTVDSAPGKGTKTTIEIPVFDIDRPVTSKAPAE